MTRFQPTWQQAGSYSAANDRLMLATLWPNGGATGLNCTADGVSEQITAAAGSAAVVLSGGNGTALCRCDAPEKVTLAAPPASGQTRIDLVCVQVRDNLIDSGGNNDWILTNVTGTPSASAPAVPAVPANAYAVCQVLVHGGQAFCAQADITDLRTGPLTVGIQANPAISVVTGAVGLPSGGGNRTVPLTAVEWSYGGFLQPTLLAANNAVVIHEAGLYGIDFCVAYDGSGTVGVAAAIINVNGATKKRVNQGATASTFMSPGGHCRLQLNIGDQVQLIAVCLASQNANTQAGTANTWLELALESR